LASIHKFASINTMENGSDVSARKDQGYASEVNSCDSSAHEVVSMHDEIIPEYLNEKQSMENLKRELEKTKLVIYELMN